MIRKKIEYIFYPTTEYKQTKMVSYQEQLAKCQDATKKYNTIWKNKEWTIKDYEDLFTDIERGYIIQGDFDTHHNYFIINPDFEEEDHQTAAQECYDLYMAKHPEARPPGDALTIDRNCYENHTECCGSGMYCEEPDGEE
jgi:hypothetical protein